MTHRRALAVFAGLLLFGALSVLSTGRTAEPSGTDSRLQALEDHVAIEQLLMRYAAALNTGDADTYVTLFTPNAEFELRRGIDEPPFLGPFKGREALRKQWFPDGARAVDARRPRPRDWPRGYLLASPRMLFAPRPELLQRVLRR